MINKTGFLPSCGCVRITVWMHHLDANETHGEKARWELHKNASSVLNKSWKQHPTKQQLYCHLPPIPQTIQGKWTKHAEHCWRTKDELISNFLLWTPTYGRDRVVRPAKVMQDRQIRKYSVNSGLSTWLDMCKWAYLVFPSVYVNIRTLVNWGLF